MSENPKLTQIRENIKQINIQDLAYNKIEIPKNLENKNITGTACLTDQNGVKIPVFISQIEINKMGKYARLESDLVYNLLNENGTQFGRLTLSLKHTEQNSEIKIGAENINYVSMDWIDTTGCPGNIKGAGNLLYQVAMEISFLNGCSGSLHLISLAESQGFHYLQGATAHMRNRYKKIKEDENTDVITYTETNEIDKISNLSIMPRWLKQDQSIRYDLQANKRRYYNEDHVFSTDNPNSLVSMQMSEHSGFDPDKNEKTDCDFFLNKEGENMLKMQTYIKWLSSQGKTPKNKMWWIKQIEINPILQITREELNNKKLILD